MSFIKMLFMLLVWNIFDDFDTTSLSQEESSDSWLINWDTEIRVCGPSFNHLMGNICGTTNIKLDYKEKIMQVQNLSIKCCEIFCQLKDIKGICIDSNLNGNYLHIPKIHTKSAELNDTIHNEPEAISKSEQKRFISKALDKILEVFL